MYARRARPSYITPTKIRRSAMMAKITLSKVEVRQQFETALATLDAHGELQITSHAETIKK